MSRKSEAKLVGIDVIIKDIKKNAITRKRVVKKMKSMLQVVGKRSDELCPKDTNALVDSRQIKVDVVDGDVVADITYGNDEAFYAVYVHEDTEKYHEPPTTHHFLEKALSEKEDWMDDELAKFAEDL